MTKDKIVYGRPTKYLESFCDEIIEFMKDGSSKTEYCAKLEICYDTLLAWKAKYPAFSESIKIADTHCQAWWEKKGKKAVFGEVEGFNSTGYIFNMKNRFAAHYKDRQEVEHSGSISHLTDDEINRKLEGLIDANKTNES